MCECASERESAHSATHNRNVFILKEFCVLSPLDFFWTQFVMIQFDSIQLSKRTRKLLLFFVSSVFSSLQCVCCCWFIIIIIHLHSIHGELIAGITINGKSVWMDG